MQRLCGSPQQVGGWSTIDVNWSCAIPLFPPVQARTVAAWWWQPPRAINRVAGVVVKVTHVRDANVALRRVIDLRLSHAQRFDRMKAPHELGTIGHRVDLGDPSPLYTERITPNDGLSCS
jgi:hypothetical protein